MMMEKKMFENKEIKVGNILVCSWGYSMTFNEFYHVVGKRGKTIFILERLQNKKLTGGGFTGTETVDLEAPPSDVRIEARLKRGRKDYLNLPHGLGKVFNPEDTVYYNTMD